MDKIKGYIDHLIFRNSDNGYTVMVVNHEGEELTGTSVATGNPVRGTIRLITQAPEFANLKMTREKGQADLSAFQIRIYTDPGQDIMPGLTIEVKNDAFSKG